MRFIDKLIVKISTTVIRKVTAIQMAIQTGVNYVLFFVLLLMILAGLVTTVWFGIGTLIK